MDKKRILFGQKGYVGFATLGPGLEFNRQGAVGFVCAINPAKNSSHNVAIRASATLVSLGAGLNTALTVGENSICLSSGANIGIGASGGITLMVIDKEED